MCISFTCELFLQVMELRGLGWQLVGMVTCISADFFVAKSQLLLVDITELGTIKLQLEVTWKYESIHITHTWMWKDFVEIFSMHKNSQMGSLRKIEFLHGKLHKYINIIIIKWKKPQWFQKAKSLKTSTSTNVSGDTICEGRWVLMCSRTLCY